MKNKQENRFSMYLTTVDFCANNVDLTAPLPNFSILFSSFQNTCDQIHLVAEAQLIDSSGSTANKTGKNKVLVALGADTARKLVAYAKLTKNQKLLKEISFTESSLSRMPDTTLAEATQLIYDRAQTHLSSLTAYLITADTQTALLQAINAYKAALSAPRLDTATLVQTTKQLAGLFKTGDEALGDMDALVEIIRTSQPIFYSGYKTARKVIDTGIGKLSVRGLVSDAQTSAPLKGVSVSFALDGDAMKAGATSEASAVLVKKTAEKGGFNVTSLAAGTYRVTLKKAGYTEPTLTVYVNDGELTLVDVKLEKIL